MKKKLISAVLQIVASTVLRVVSLLIILLGFFNLATSLENQSVSSLLAWSVPMTIGFILLLLTTFWQQSIGE